MPQTARSPKFYRCLALVTLALLLLAPLVRAQETDDTQEAPGTAIYYLLRHAEKVDASADPPLSPEGEGRALGLARRLSGAGITHLHSTDYQRTRDTLAPLAEATGLSVEIYDPQDLAGFAARLLEMDGVHVVVGHSNTTPELAKLLGGDPGQRIDESEYARLYVVTRYAEGSVSSQIRHLPAEPAPVEPVPADELPVN